MRGMRGVRGLSRVMMVAKIMMALLRRVFSFLLRRGSADPAKIAARASYFSSTDQYCD